MLQFVLQWISSKRLYFNHVGNIHVVILQATPFVERRGSGCAATIELSPRNHSAARLDNMILTSTKPTMVHLPLYGSDWS